MPAYRPEASPPCKSAPAASGSGQTRRSRIPDVLPVLPIRGTVMFPGTVTPLNVGRPSSRKLLDEWLPQSKIIAIVTQRDEDDDEPGPDDLYTMGTRPC